jgi:hypothetical protein
MQNLTLAIEEEVLLAARKLALDRNTTVNKLVREFLASLVRQDESRRAALERLRGRMQDGVLEVGGRGWSREDLHER